MSETYAVLISEWRQAADATRMAQAALKAQFDAHLEGGPPPRDKDVRRLHELRAVESRKLEKAMQYAKRAAHAPATGQGSLQ